MVAGEGEIERGERETEKKVERGEGRNSAGEEKKATFLRSFVHSALTFCHGTILFGAREGKRAKTLYHISMIGSITLTYMYSPSSIRLALRFRRGLSRCRGWP